VITPTLRIVCHLMAVILDYAIIWITNVKIIATAIPDIRMKIHNVKIWIWVIKVKVIGNSTIR